MFSGLSHAVRQWSVLRPREPALLRDALPRQARVAVRRMSQADRRPVHNGHVQEVPPGAFRVRLLPETAQQGNVQRAKRETVLPFVFREAVRIDRRGRCATPPADDNMTIDDDDRSI